MSIKIYKEFEHPAGFIGIRLCSTVEGKYRQQYYNFKNRETGKLFSKKRQKEMLEEARQLEAEWALENKEYVYQRKISQPHPKTKKEASTGVEGLTLTFLIDSSGSSKTYYYPVFRVELPRDKLRQKCFRFTDISYTKAWREAVELWAQVHEIRPKDRDALIKRMPPPSQFVQLRRAMNADGHTIPTSALRHIFAEQRQEVKIKKEKAAGAVDLATAIERELQSFLTKPRVISGR